MDVAQLEQDINAAWEARDTIAADTTGPVREAVTAALEMMDSGAARVAEPRGDHQWQVNQWLKKAVLLSFRLNDNVMIDNGPGAGHWWDKVPSKFAGWDEAAFRAAGFRAVPGSFARAVSIACAAWERREACSRARIASPSVASFSVSGGGARSAATAAGSCGCCCAGCY